MGSLVQKELLSQYTTTLGDGDGIADAKYLIGGKSTNYYVGNINFNKWDDEAWVNINPKQINFQTASKEVFTNGLIQVEASGFKFNTYVDTNGRLEHEIVFRERPALGHFDHEFICSNNIFCDKQTLTEEDIKAGHIRRPHIVDSIVGYINKRNNNYKMGKIFTLYRPWLIGDNGDWRWIDQAIENNIWRKDWSSLSQWLDNAKYPVILGPTIGNTNCGASGPLGINNTARGVRGTTDGSGGNASKITACLESWGSGDPVGGAIYAEGSDPIDLEGNTPDDDTGGTNGQFHDFTFSVEPALAATTDYYSVIKATASVEVWYDSTSTNRVFGEIIGAWTDPWEPSGGHGSSTFHYSVYATYEGVGGGRIMSSLVGPGGLVSSGGIAGHGGGLAG